MLSRLRNMFRVADLRNKILFTLFVIAIYRLGSHLPLPYVDFSVIQILKDQAGQGGHGQEAERAHDGYLAVT